MNNILIYTVKVLIFNLIFFTFLYAFLPRGTFLLIKDVFEEVKLISNKELIQKQLIGSLTSCFAVKEKINRSNIKNNKQLFEYGQQHVNEICK